MERAKFQCRLVCYDLSLDQRDKGRAALGNLDRIWLAQPVLEDALCKLRINASVNTMDIDRVGGRPQSQLIKRDVDGTF